MRQLFAVALVVGLMAAPACAQRGGGGHGGFGGGHAGFSSRGGFSGGGMGRVMGGAVAPRYGVSGGPVARYGGPGVSGARPSFYHPGYHSGRGPRRGGVGYGAPYGYAYYGPLDYGWLDANDPDYGDSYGDDGGYDDGSYDNGADVAADGYEEQAPAGYGQEPEEQPEAPYPVQAPYVAQPQYAETAPAESGPAAPAVTPSLYDSDAVTLVFKDGRPPEKIHNYALTRTTLYVTDGRRQEIPVAALDLAATEKANREAGVSFQLPVAQ